MDKSADPMSVHPVIVDAHQNKIDPILTHGKTSGTEILLKFIDLYHIEEWFGLFHHLYFRIGEDHRIFDFNFTVDHVIKKIIKKFLLSQKLVRRTVKFTVIPVTVLFLFFIQQPSAILKKFETTCLIFSFLGYSESLGF